MWKRLTHYVPYEIRTISDIKTSEALTAERQEEMEGRFILQQIQPGSRVVLCDEHGREMTSREFAGYLEKAMSLQSRRGCCLSLEGHMASQKVYGRADGKLIVIWK